MDDVLGYGDDSWWKGLACPPLEDFAFNFDNFDQTCDKIDCILDDPLLEGEIQEEDSIVTNVRTHFSQVLEIEKPRIESYDSQLMHQAKDMTGRDYGTEVAGVDNRTTKDAAVNKKSNHCYGNFGKGKELKLNLNMAEIKAFLEQDIEEEEVVEKTKIKNDFDCQPVERKDRMRPNNTNPFAVVDNKKNDDLGFRLEASCRTSVVTDKKRKADADFRLDTSRNKVQKTYESACQPMRREDKMRLDDMNEVAKKKKETDYNSRFEATTHKLHESYDRLREAKQRKQIQVIEFQKLAVEQPRCKAKSKGKSCLRQRLMAMGTHRSSKKLHPYVY